MSLPVKSGKGDDPSFGPCKLQKIECGLWVAWECSEAVGGI
jgi:hypothetical protein